MIPSATPRISFCEVAVNAPVGYDRTLSYSIPPSLDLEPGQMVWVPLGARPVQGIVIQLESRPVVDTTKDVYAAVEPSPLVSPHAILLARWISRHYMASLFDSLTLMLPPGFETRVRGYLRAASHGGETPSQISANGKVALDLLRARKEVPEREIAKILGREGRGELQRFLRRGLVVRRWELSRPTVTHKYDGHLRLTSEGFGDQYGTHPLPRAPRQAALLAALAALKGPLPLAVANREFGRGAVSALVAKGLLAMEWTRREREPALQRWGPAGAAQSLHLTTEQAGSVRCITAAFEGGPEPRGPFLLHGVTGSGKTEVYLRALEHYIRMGKKGILLVPEISLTPQTVHQLNTRFPGRVALLHSGLTVGERFDQWWRIRDGEYDVVVGPRSAVFAPVPDLGLIVMDEEHEWTYKQQEAPPHYHARTVALKAAELSGAVVVMGSATPDVESYYNAKRGEYVLLELPRRIAPAGAGRSRPSDLAQVEVCDMRQELKEGNRSIFSRALATALAECTRRGEQAILFLNRRGSSTVVQCRDCGHALRCRRCSVSLTYHSVDMRLLCHRCNRRSLPPSGCPQCRSPRIRYLGLGTQRVADELARLLPRVSALRWDRDTAQVPDAHNRTLERFLRGEAQVLIGTQMVAKGLHMPGVTLVGVVLADVGLNIPDFRAAERTFQLICQVAGRAGRESPGKAIIQTYHPSSYALVAAAGQDYSRLYHDEIRHRTQHGNPPFSRLIHMVHVHSNATTCQREAQRMGRLLRHRAYSIGLTDVEVVGPAPAFPERVRSRFRWHLILRGWNLQSFLEGVPMPHGWTVNVDPVSLA